MIKHDVIPKHFRHRYLLADFDLVEVDALDGTGGGGGGRLLCVW